MISKRTSVIEKIVLNDATYQTEEILPSFINFFYGKNGAGKSTIGRALRENIGIEWANGKNGADFDTLVYNQGFIEKHFESYENLDGVFTVGEKNIAIQQQVEEKLKEKVKLEEDARTQKESKENKVKEVQMSTVAFQDTCWEELKEIRTCMGESLKGTRKKDSLATKILSLTKAHEHDLTNLKKMYNVAFDESSRTYREFSCIRDTTTYGELRGKALLENIIVSSSDSPFASFMKALNASDWVRQGHVNYSSSADGKCPYCQQTIPDSFEDNLVACFDASYQDDIDALNTFNDTYIRENNALMNTLKNNLNDIMLSIDSSLLKDYKAKLALIEKSIEINIQIINNKIKEPATPVFLKDTDSILEEIDSLIDEVNKVIRANNDVVNDRKTQKTLCTSMVWEHISYILKDKIDEYNDKQIDFKKDIYELEQKEIKYKCDINDIKLEIDNLNRQIVNTLAAIKSINDLLKDSGFQGFSLREKVGVQNTYEVIRQDGTVAKRLSEGERNFIAFLYFYHLVRGSSSSDGTKEKVVVIDDPVSSMDSSTLFIVSSIVRELIGICHNNTTYPDESNPGRYIKQIFILTHNVYFHREITYNQVDRYECSNFYIIRKTDNISQIKLCDRKNKIKPSERENYNPVQNSYTSLWDEFKEINSPIPLLNIIRQILEYYFLQICGYDGENLRQEILVKNKHRFITTVDGQIPNMEKYNLADSMITYINNSKGIIDGLHLTEECEDAEVYKSAFKLIFEVLNQEQHYNMMMGVSNKGS